ncbi:MAG TPA: glycosyltransferase family 2 protein [Candidatus Dependentiae bacterium]|nr:glycosyltransferase family 2 protein [Candidatus Dependentiae bacterium]HRQ63096.1 glycosyltransferase family 2 protein [Candidatus Dependentiae bacterium]
MKRWMLSLVLLGALVIGYATLMPTSKSIVVVIPSYNNAHWYEKNLSRLFSQTYKNWRAIYIDDCSTDGTADLVEQYIKKQGQSHRVRLIKNETNKGALANIYHAVYSCADRDIIVLLDGDDWFHTDEALSIVAKAYEDESVWMTYGQFVEYPYGKKGFCCPIPREVIEKNAYRNYTWITSHLRTFYTWLFKKIKTEDLMYNGDFFSVTWDMAIVFPLLEMAGGRCKFIPEVLYEYNMATPLNDFKTKLQLQQHCNRLIRQRPRYAPLKEPALRTPHVDEWWKRA